ncbi:MAG: YmdB family metallophosphoesterase [Holosporaceae bacterium]|jgi:metallophosphoesterase (TIGR00282 family)|nr:YmdB family metallophosphoesterase [Holosporaceae bacterium]
MKILICGDVVGRSGRESVAKYLPDLKKKLSIDIVIVDVDNAAHGFGITKEIAYQFFDLGADVLTSGNHLFDQKEAISLLEKEKRFLRPANMADVVPGSGIIEIITNSCQKVLVVHLLGQRDMPIIGENPFNFMDKLLQKYKIKRNIDVIVVEFHAETTSEKIALGHYLDGRVSVVVGTHTHVPTADAVVLESGTAFQTDIGMCGDYDSVIGMHKQAIIDKFVKGYGAKFAPATGEATFCASLVDVDDKKGLATAIMPLILGGKLKFSSL